MTLTEGAYWVAEKWASSLLPPAERLRAAAARARGCWPQANPFGQVPVQGHQHQAHPCQHCQRVPSSPQPGSKQEQQHILGSGNHHEWRMKQLSSIPWRWRPTVLCIVAVTGLAYRSVLLHDCHHVVALLVLLPHFGWLATSLSIWFLLQLCGAA